MAPGVPDAPGRRHRTSAAVATALVYIGLVLLVVVAFLGIVLGGGAVTGAGDQNTALMLAATAVVAVAFEPVRGRLRALVDQLVLGHHASAWEAVSRLSSEMGDQNDPDRVFAILAEVIWAATGTDGVVVWVKVDRKMAPVASRPGSWAAEPLTVDSEGVVRVEGADLVVPIRRPHLGDVPEEEVVVGAITVAGPVSTIEQQLVEDLAAAAWTVVQTVHLRESLNHRLELAGRQQAELLEARVRTASAQLTERRRLERDIHDSGQQRAVVLAGKLGLARSLMATVPAQAAEVLGEAEGDIDRLSTTLAELVEGRRLPEFLDDGIGVAVQAATSDLGVRVDVTDETGGSYPRPIREAIYACCAEAVQNALKHATASRIEVRLHEDAGRLHVSIRDDGVGFDTTGHSTGVGLANMRERLRALDGQLVVRSGPRGTEVLGQVPVPKVMARA